MFKLTFVALAVCLAVAVAETQTQEIFDSAAVPLSADPISEQKGDLNTEEHKLKAYMATPNYAAMPIYGAPSYGIPTYAMSSYMIPSYGMPSVPSYGYASYPSYGYGYGYPLPMQMALLGHKMKYHY